MEMVLMNQFSEMSFEEMDLVNGGIGWQDVGFALVTTAGGIIGGVVGGAVGTALCPGAGTAAGAGGGAKVGTTIGTLVGVALFGGGYVVVTN